MSPSSASCQASSWLNKSPTILTKSSAINWEHFIKEWPRQKLITIIHFFKGLFYILSIFKEWHRKNRHLVEFFIGSFVNFFMGNFSSYQYPPNYQLLRHRRYFHHRSSGQEEVVRPEGEKWTEVSWPFPIRITKGFNGYDIRAPSNLMSSEAFSNPWPFSYFLTSINWKRVPLVICCSVSSKSQILLRIFVVIFFGSELTVLAAVTTWKSTNYKPLDRDVWT